jgi:hypothetical protein
MSGMPKTNFANKPVHSFRLSLEGVRQLKELAGDMGRSESDVLEVALDRMYREEIRFGRLVRESNNSENTYHVNKESEEK